MHKPASGIGSQLETFNDRTTGGRPDLNLIGKLGKGPPFSHRNASGGQSVPQHKRRAGTDIHVNSLSEPRPGKGNAGFREPFQASAWFNRQTNLLNGRIREASVDAIRRGTGYQ